MLTALCLFFILCNNRPQRHQDIRILLACHTVNTRIPRLSPLVCLGRPRRSCRQHPTPRRRTASLLRTSHNPVPLSRVYGNLPRKPRKVKALKQVELSIGPHFSDTGSVNGIFIQCNIYVFCASSLIVHQCVFLAEFL